MSDHEAPRKPDKGARPDDTDKVALDAPPDWDRMGQIADRLLSTPPDRQPARTTMAPKRKVKQRR